jgi:hypothetical protein
MAEYMGRLGVVAVVALMLASCAEARMSDSGSAAPTTGSYGISGDAGSHGSVYSWLFGPNDSRASQSVADARAVTPPSAGGSATAAPGRPTGMASARSAGGSSQPPAPSAATPGMAAAAPAPASTSGAYGISSDAGSHGSVYSYLFGQNGKPPQVATDPAVPVTSYGIPADAGSHGSLYSILFGSKDAPASPSNGSGEPSGAKPNAPPPSQ